MYSSTVLTLFTLQMTEEYRTYAKNSFLPIREETSSIIYDTKPSKNINVTRKIHLEPELSNIPDQSNSSATRLDVTGNGT